MAREPVEHVVKVKIKDGQFTYTGHKECFCVYPGDTIRWIFQHKLPYFIIIKALVSPFSISCEIAEAGKETEARIYKGAVPGIYAYAIGTFDGTRLLIDDPEIIIKPPKDGK